MSEVQTKLYTLLDILRSTDYSLDIFTPEEIAALQIYDKRGKPYVTDFADGKERPAKPEEIVRQLYLYRLIHTYGYPIKRIAVERGVQFGSSIAEKRADIVVLDRDNPDTAYIIIEVKKPKRSDGLEQLKSYCNAEGAPIGVWTNGGELIALHREDPNIYRNLPDIPHVNQTLAEVINRRVTIEELRQNNKLVTERWTLKKIILDLENLVLANAGVDAFEEVFKLIYAKLYDEWSASRRAGHYVEFIAAGETATELYEKINRLFVQASEKWPGVFLPGDSIDLTPDHLAVCVSFLQEIALFNSNLQIIDEAFEYLVTQVSKGAKGQYFTPRHVIDMCVKMLNPRSHEYMIDTAAGSCGFTVHTIFWVWGGEFTANGPSREQVEYANEMVYGIDFDARSVKIAKALNLIAGDGKTNVYRLNTLDPRTWDEAGRVGLRPRLRRFPGNRELDDWNKANFRYFNFDVLMTNPPFAGDIKDARILHGYDLAASEDGKRLGKVGRDILFIERNLDFLKPGGRMAIVLPQGRFNNVSDERIRRFIAQRARILAVVGLHVNSFKPHTGTKTSVLFLQKWTDEEQEERETYRSQLKSEFELAVEDCRILNGYKNWPQIADKQDYSGELRAALSRLASQVIEGGKDRDPLWWERTKKRIHDQIRDAFVEKQFNAQYDYPIFFATSERGGKGNSGEYVFVKDEFGQPSLDEHGHMIVDHDLDEIADAFVSFSRRQGFNFAGES